MQFFEKPIFFIIISSVLVLLVSYWFFNTQQQMPVADLAFNTGEQYELEGNYLKAADCYKKAALSGSAKAQIKLAHYYRDGKGTSQNVVQAAKWLTKAAEQGQVEAQFELANMHYTGKGIVQNLPLAAQWYRQAAEQGLAEAQFRIGVMYLEGEGISSYLPDAAQWLKKAADQNHTEAKHLLMTLQAEVPKLFEAEKFQETYELAMIFDAPALQKIAIRAKQKMWLALTQLQYLYGKGDYENVIAQGRLKIHYGKDIAELIEKVKQVQVVQKKASQLLKENKLQQVVEIASPYDAPELQELVARAKRQIYLTLTELQNLYANGDYEGVITQGQSKVIFSDDIKQIVEAALTKHHKIKRQQMKAALQTTLDNNPLSATQITLAVFGDSLADGIWAAIYRELRSDKHVKVLRETMTSSGLTAFDWATKVKKILKQQPIHIAVIVVGTNDGQVLIQGRKRIAYKSASWKKAYVQRINDLMGLLETHKIPTYWVGLPAVRRSNLEEQVIMFNEFYEQSAALFSVVRFLSTWHLTVDKEGKYSAYGLDKTGRKRLLRANDGVHFTIRGYDLLADYILKHIYEDLPFIKKDRNKNA